MENLKAINLGEQEFKKYENGLDLWINKNLWYICPNKCIVCLLSSICCPSCFICLDFLADSVELVDKIKGYKKFVFNGFTREDDGCDKW